MHASYRDKLHMTVCVHFYICFKDHRHLERIPFSDDDRGKTGLSMDKPWLRFYAG